GELGLQLLRLSPEPLVDIIFVHGLRGGSVKTWRKGDDPALFWPKAWLPFEKGFEHANIYSFGYDSDWLTATKRLLNVHNFGTELFETPIILVGHSMGGLVIKKASTDAFSAFSDSLKTRLRCIFFLATPHRGSDYAGILRNILSVSGVPKDYVHDLTKGASSTEVINEDFVRFIDDVSLFSFYESLPMKIGGVSSGLIVEKSSAVLGMPSHSFSDPFDPNYIKLRDSLGSAIGDILRGVMIGKQKEAREHLRVLRTLLGIPGQPDDFYDKVDGSCEWINDREDFTQWRDTTTDISTKDGRHDPVLYWVSANPGIGKTVLAGHVVSHLKEYNLQCSHHHFHAENRTLGAFLRSMAYQMAMSNASTRDMLVRAHQDGLTFDQDDSRTIWAKVFRGCIFEVSASILNTQYWVIDAVDECLKYNELFTLLKAEKPKFPLQVFFTSRKYPEIRRLLAPFQSQLTAIDIPISDTMADIERYIISRMNELVVESATEKANLAQLILAKSSGSFLWVRLVLDELRLLTANNSMTEVLAGIPKGMTPYYERIVGRMAENEREKHIAKAILRWVVLTARPLSTLDISQALELETKTNFPSISAAIEMLCGQLVYIDKQTDLVHIVHATAREFLLSSSAGEFQIVRAAGHERTTITCLQLLCSRALAPPRHRHFLTDRKPISKGLLKYAMSHFSEHVHGAPSESAMILTELDRFLRSNILRWIEMQAIRGDLHSLIRAAKDLTSFLERRAKHVTPLAQQLQARSVEGWSVSLSRLATKFGKALLTSPSSIYFLIPPLCPTSGVVHKSFGRNPDGLSLLGSRTADWDDCIAAIDFEDRIASAVACGATQIAVGMECGDVAIYHHLSFQLERTTLTKYPIDLLHFLEPGGNVAGCSSKFLTLWDRKGAVLWATRLRSRCLFLVSTSTELVGVTESGRSLTWDLTSGRLLEQRSFPYQQPDLDDDQGIDYRTVPSRAPGFVSMSPDMEVLALGYRTGPVCLWDFQQKLFIGWAMDENNGVANHVLFNPNPNHSRVLVAYGGSTLGLYDSWSGSLIHYTDPDPGKHNNYASIASSPNGNTLATVDLLGTLRVLDFESLTPLYQVQTPALSFRSLTFSSDGANIIDVTDSHMRIWSPATLIRMAVDEEANASETDLSALTVVEGKYESVRGAKITAVYAHPTRPIVFIANNQGETLACHSKTGFKRTVLYQHPHQAYVKEIAASSTDLIASCDVNSLVQICKLDVTKPTSVRISTMVVSLRLHAPVRQLVFSTSGKWLLVSTTESDSVYSTKDGSLIGTQAFTRSANCSWRWLAPEAAGEADQFILILESQFLRYSAPEFPCMAVQSLPGESLSLQYSLGDGCTPTGFDSAVFDAHTRTLFLAVRHQSGHAFSSTLCLFRLPNVPEGLHSITLPPFAQMFSNECDRFIGISTRGKSAVFLHADSWISSVKLRDDESAGQYSQYIRHFFVPGELIRRAHEILPVITCEDDIVFCLHGELSVVRNGLKFETVLPLR
ncbi:NACHT and WD domain protein, partial [Coniochaeta sp. 2T2.1]